MQRTIIPKTNLVTSRIGFGTSALHHLLSEKQRLQLLKSTLDFGITHFDTARMYGEGMAERSLGALIHGGLRHQLTLATKVGIPANIIFEKYPKFMYGQRALVAIGRKAGFFWNNEERVRRLSAESVEISLLKSLSALRTDWLDILYIHEPYIKDIPALENLSDWLFRQKKSGRVRFLGVSGNAEVALKIHTALPGLFDIFQVEDSIANCEADCLTISGLPLQLTYGYIRLAQKSHDTQGGGSLNYPNILKAALERNVDGVVLISSTKINHIKQFGDLV